MQGKRTLDETRCCTYAASRTVIALQRYIYIGFVASRLQTQPRSRRDFPESLRPVQQYTTVLGRFIYSTCLGEAYEINVASLKRLPCTEIVVRSLPVAPGTKRVGQVTTNVAGFNH